MTAEQQRSNLVSRNSLISDMDGVNMMWRESVTIYFASPTSPVNSGTLADADKTTVKFLNDCYSDFNYTRGTDEDWLKVEQLSRRLTAANMKDGSSAQQRNDMPPPQSKQ